MEKRSACEGESDGSDWAIMGKKSEIVLVNHRRRGQRWGKWREKNMSGPDSHRKPGTEV